MPGGSPALRPLAKGARVAKVVICRCEDVLLAEIEDAVRAGNEDIESLKRYTGFGTGWCQGKWCVSLCARLLTERGGAAGLPITPRRTRPSRPARSCA